MKSYGYQKGNSSSDIPASGIGADTQLGDVSSSILGGASNDSLFNDGTRISMYTDWSVGRGIENGASRFTLPHTGGEKWRVAA